MSQNLAADIAGTRVAIVDLDTGDIVEEIDHGTIAKAEAAYEQLKVDLADLGDD